MIRLTNYLPFVTFNRPLSSWMEGKSATEIYQRQIEWLVKEFHTYEERDAKQILQTLDRDWQEYKVSEPKGEDFVDPETGVSIPYEGPPDPFVFDPPVSPEAPRGLNNWGNDCFLVALFQVVLLGDLDIQEILCKKIPLIKNFLQAYQTSAPISMKVLREFLSINTSLGQNFLVGQHDPGEALMGLLQACGSEYLASSPLANKRVIRKIYEPLPEGYRFAGEDEVPITERVSFYSGEGISIPFALNANGQVQVSLRDGKIHLNDLLDFMQNRENRDPKDGCLKKQVLSPKGELEEREIALQRETFQFNCPPESLILSLGRCLSGAKIVNPVEIPELLPLSSDFFVQSPSQETLYELQGFIVHQGLHFNYGHYTAYVSRQAEDGQKLYFFCDDGYVQPIDQNTFLERAKTAYILHFRKG